MRRGKYTVPPPRAFFALVLIWPLLSLCAPSAGAQELRIKVLNGRNGRLITNECVSIWLGPWHGADLVAPTNKQGVVVLHLENDRVTAEQVPPLTCNKLAIYGPIRLPPAVDTLGITSDYYADCQEYAKVVPNPAKPKFIRKIPPSYPIKEILESGISASNTCGKFRAKPKPGELIFFVRPRGFWEKMRE